ncbi:MAG: serine/threonine protein kinase [Spirulinaceae cyanobacterium SM2_1_0]|nr:serine/threonine protein kinase [Spirulinaceae cyanobacterium SM2_1_0]
MINLPDFRNYGYRIERELGNNRGAGRATYLATEYNTERSVVVKQFQFAGDRHWEDYDAHQHEIAILRNLDHPQIPRYLDSFQTGSGFCMVQEYKNAPSLAEPRLWTLAQVRQIALATLEILQYLQQQIPPIIHRDLKPENILVDDNLTVYLVDFGLARLGGGQVAASSVVKGTLGFMPPEQLFNRELSAASDLYSLGLTLLCLLTHVPSLEVGMLVNSSGRVEFAERLPDLSPEFAAWLMQMTASDRLRRYPNATEARQSLLAIRKLRQRLPSQWRAIAQHTLVATTVVAVGVAGAIAIIPATRRGAIARLQPATEQIAKSLNPAPPDRNSRNYIDGPPAGFEVADVQATVTLTSGIDAEGQPIDELDAPPASGEWYAHLSASNLPDASYLVSCAVQPDGTELIELDTPIQVLLATGKQLQAWCRYSEPMTGQLLWLLEMETVAVRSLTNDPPNQ